MFPHIWFSDFVGTLQNFHQQKHLQGRWPIGIAIGFPCSPIGFHCPIRWPIRWPIQWILPILRTGFWTHPFQIFQTLFRRRRFRRYGMERPVRKSECFGGKTKTGLGTAMLKKPANLKPKGIATDLVVPSCCSTKAFKLSPTIAPYSNLQCFGFFRPQGIQTRSWSSPESTHMQIPAWARTIQLVYGRYITPIKNGRKIHEYKWDVVTLPYRKYIPILISYL